jgi:RNA polymerase sigma factor (TIGR02999 family)
MERTHDVTAILEALSSGKEAAADELFAVVYEELRGIAGSFMAQERSDHTLQPTAVVHEAYMRLVGSSSLQWESRGHFFGTAAAAMRRILVDHARRKVASKRGGDRQRVELGDPEAPETRFEELLDLDAALGRLAARDETMAKVVGTWEPASVVAGRFRILRRIGAGGMGEVYEAERTDESVEQRVAIKLVRPGLDAERIEELFLRERQILSRLDHPNIARFLDAGATAEGRPYFVMEHVEGRPIDRYCREKGLRVDDRLRLFCTVCDAVSYAHRNLVVHRDLKPSNILVTPEGHPKLLDFGVAKLVSPDDAVTRTRVMTPAYASPEQLRGAPVTTTSDVYSLGVILYELLVGRPPHGAGGNPPSSSPARSSRRRRRGPAPRSWRPGGRTLPRPRSPASPTPGAAAAACVATWTSSSSPRCTRTPAGATTPPDSWPRTSCDISRGCRSPPGPTPGRTAWASSPGVTGPASSWAS